LSFYILKISRQFYVEYAHAILSIPQLARISSDSPSFSFPSLLSIHGRNARFLTEEMWHKLCGTAKRNWQLDACRIDHNSIIPVSIPIDKIASAVPEANATAVTAALFLRDGSILLSWK
jgi:hypothetical protein